MSSVKTKKIIKPIVITVTVIILLLAFIGNLFFSIALKSDSPIAADKLLYKVMTDNKALAEGFSGYTGSPEEKAWYKSVRQNVYIQTEDGLKLHGYKINNENNNGKYVIACHGYGGRADEFGRYAKYFYDMGYSVILPDARAHGQSEGNIKYMGWQERLDLLTWIDEIIKEEPNAKIVLFGVSMGASTVMMASGEDLPEQVKAIVEDCGYSSVWDEFEYVLKSNLHLPAFPTMQVSSLVTKIRAGYSFKEASAVEQVKKSKTPTLFIHGSNDTFVPFFMLDMVYDAASCEKEKLVVEGAGHAGSTRKDPKLYWETIEKFLIKHVE